MLQKKSFRNKKIGLLLFVPLLFIGGMVHAASSSDVSQLKQTITEKKAVISSLNSKLETYRAKIKTLAGKSASLQNDIALLENETAMTELDVASTQNAIDAEQLELRIIDDQVADTQTELVKRRAMLSDLLFALNKTDGQDVVDMVLHVGSINDVFDAAQQLTSVNADMKSALEATKLTQANLESRQADHQEKEKELADAQILLQQKADDLETHKNAKIVLAEATNESENEYRTLMSELRSEQQAITNDVENLQGKLESKLKEHDGDTSGSTIISWPVHGIITTLFHDPTYPFRNLFEHSGLDIAVPQGTAIEAAAPGYVAWAKKGNMYGNYVMIVHANGFATLYAHMSRIDVHQDDYIARGQVIGLSGGRPGTNGAGFSTGPHVHFEVRLNGIPTNPFSYLPNE